MCSKNEKLLKIETQFRIIDIELYEQNKEMAFGSSIRQLLIHIYAFYLFERMHTCQTQMCTSIPIFHLLIESRVINSYRYRGRLHF